MRGPAGGRRRRVGHPVVRRAPRLRARLAGAAGLALLVASCVGVATPEPSSAVAGSPSLAPSATAPVDPSSRPSTVAVAELPPEALATIRRIRAGGSFTHAADVVEYANAAGALPAQAAGYYHAYRVPVPAAEAGSDVIVAGARGEMYWTTDGGLTFVRVVP